MRTMNRRTRRLLSYASSAMLGLTFFVLGSHLLYADYRHTTTVTTTTMPVSMQPPTVIQTQVIQPANVSPSTVNRQQVNSFITYDINVKKEFQSNENVRGEIIVNNTSSAPLSDSFHTRLYHNGKLVKELVTNVAQIPSGQTKFSFDGFGIPQMNDSGAASGNWSISIYDLDPAYSKDVDFRIMNPTSLNNTAR